MLTLDKIYQASHVLRSVIRKTDLIQAPKLCPDCDLFLKTENLQVTGSFKVRGAYYMMSQLTDEEKARGVIACSAGNHAQGVALAAAKNHMKALICLPDGAPISKVEATKSYGAEVCMVKGVYDDAYNKAVELQKEHNYTFVHPFDNENVIAGQGTIGLEILEQNPDIDTIVAPIGGGGLAVSQITCLDSVSTIADGIAVKEPGPHTFEYVKKYVDDIVTVTDDEISAAILALIEKQKLIAEGAGAASVAAAMFHKVPVEGKKVVCLVSGGNIDVTILSRVIKRGLLMSGRSCMLNIELLDKPGQLKDVSRIIADLGGNVISIHHERANEGSDINGCCLRITMEPRDYAHIQESRSALMGAGFHLVD